MEQQYNNTSPENNNQGTEYNTRPAYNGFQGANAPGNSGNAQPAFYQPPMQTLKAGPKRIFDITKKDLAFLISITVSLFLFIRIGVFEGFNLGFGISYILLAGSCTVYTFCKSAKYKIFYSTVVLLEVLLGISFFFHNDFFLKFIDFFALLILTEISINGLSGSVKNEDFGYAFAADILRYSFIGAFENFALPFSSLKAKLKSGKSKKSVNILAGILIALPVLCIIVPVLSSADFAFEALISSVFKNLGLIIACIVLTVVFAPFFASYTFSLNKGVVRNNGKTTVTPEGKVSPSLLNSFLISISIAYIAYLISQLAYITDALAFLLPEEFTAAEFARRGFFEMAVISFINLIIVCVCSALVKNKENGKMPVLTKILLVFLCVFSLFYIVSALYRMFLYISLFALTKLRILTSVFMVMLILIFIVILINIFIKKLHYMKPIILICAVTVCVLSFADINSFIAEYNYNAWVEKGIELDVYEIYNTGSGYEQLLKIYEDKTLSEEKRSEATGFITDIIFENYDLPEEDGYWIEEINETQIKNLSREHHLFDYNISREKNLSVIDDLIKNKPQKVQEITKFYSDYMYDYDEDITYTEDTVNEYI